MASREGKDTAIMLEGRKQRSKEVKIVFINPNDFNVVDEEGSLKYLGKISDDKTNDECECPSFQFGMKYESMSSDGKAGESRYLAENGFSFQCKHLIKAHEIRGN